MTQIGQRSLDSPIPSTAVLFRHAPHRILDLGGFSRSAASRLPLPSYFCAINRRCQASRVSGVTIVAISRRSLLLSPLALAANRRRWSFRAEPTVHALYSRLNR